MNNEKNPRLNELEVSYCSPKALGTAQLRKWSWDTIVEKLGAALVDKLTMEQYLALTPLQQLEKKSAPGLFFGGKCESERRQLPYIQSRSVVTLDLDDDVDAVWADLTATGSVTGLAGITHFVHTTRKHTATKPRIRIVVPLLIDVSRDEYQPVARALAEKVDSGMKAVARESFSVAQGMFFPSVCKGSDFKVFTADGEPYDPAPALLKYKPGDASNWPKRPGEEAIQTGGGSKIAHPEEKKAVAPIITALHRAYSPQQFILTFLDHVYKVGNNGRFIHVKATGAPSVRIYDDAFIHSDHGTSDPAFGQHNTFDLGRIHLFGHLDKDIDTKGMSPFEWPSFKAMSDWARKDPQVIRELEAVQAEVSEENARRLMDLLGEADDDPIDEAEAPVDDDDLLGAPPKKVKKKVKSLDDVLARIRANIAKAETLDDLMRFVEKVAALPTTEFKELHRGLVTADLQAKMDSLGNKITKAEAKAMLKPTIENLKDQEKGKPTPDWLESWVFLVDEAKFMNTETLEVASREGFNGRFATDVADHFGMNDLGLTILQAHDAALSIFDIPKPYSMRFDPNKESMFEEDGVSFVNSYRAPEFENDKYKGEKGVKMLKRLLADLFPDREHQCLVLDFMAHIVKHPGKKLMYAMLIKGCQNEGKSLFYNLMERMLGVSNCSVVGTNQIKERFNGWAADKLLCMVEEVRVSGREAHEILDSLKPLVTNRRVAIEKKGVESATMRNFCNLYLATNYDDAIPIDDGDTRYMILFTRFKTGVEVETWRQDLIAEDDGDYRSMLADEIEHHPLQFVRFFENYVFSEFYKPTGRAPATVFRSAMIEDAKTDERRLLEDTIDAGTHPLVSNEILVWDHFKSELDLKLMGKNLRGRGVSAFLGSLGFMRVKDTRRKMNGENVKIRIWTKRRDFIRDDGILSSKGSDALSLKWAKVEFDPFGDDDDDLI